MLVYTSPSGALVTYAAMMFFVFAATGEFITDYPDLDIAQWAADKI